MLGLRSVHEGTSAFAGLAMNSSEIQRSFNLAARALSKVICAIVQEADGRMS
jgi:hypothetical protein